MRQNPFQIEMFFSRWPSLQRSIVTVFTQVFQRFAQVHSPVLKETFLFEEEKSRWKFVPLEYPEISMFVPRFSSRTTDQNIGTFNVHELF